VAPTKEGVPFSKKRGGKARITEVGVFRDPPGKPGLGLGDPSKESPTCPNLRKTNMTFENKARRKNEVARRLG